MGAHDSENRAAHLHQEFIGVFTPLTHVSCCVLLFSDLFLPGLDAPPSSWVIMPHDRGSSLQVAIDNLLYLTEKGQCNRLVSCSIQ